MSSDNSSDARLQSLDEWEDFLKTRYPKGSLSDASHPKPSLAIEPNKKPEEFRNHSQANARVREFYRLNHTYQTRDFAVKKKSEFLKLNRMSMGIWEALEFLNTLADDSDPDTQLSQIEHCLQTAEAIRRDGHPRWFILTGLVHDLGKILCLWGEAQWAVVGDTFPVGCAFSPKIVYPEFFAFNPDVNVPAYQTRLGIYEQSCGLDRVDLSWGHDEYLYHVVKDYLPDEGLYMIRCHSFYAGHQEGEYEYLMNDHDKKMLKWVQRFSPYDLYSKANERPVVDELRPYYEELIGEFFPSKVRW